MFILLIGIIPFIFASNFPAVSTTSGSSVTVTTYSSNITNLDDLNDTNTVGVLDGQALVYDDTDGMWKPLTISGITDTFEANYSDYLIVKAYSLNDSRWTLNYSDYLITKVYASNDTNYNATGLIQNWSLIITGSSDTFVANYSDYLTTKNYALNDSRWTLNYSDYLIIRTYALNDSLWTSNYSDYLITKLYATNSTGNASTGNCPAGQVVQNVTSNGVQCASASGSDTFVANYSTFLTHITWTQATNGTLALNSTFQNYYTKGEVTTNISSANTSVVNWVDLLFVKIANLVSYVGNWSLDKPNYANYSNSTTTFQEDIGVDCSAGDFVKGVDDNGVLDCATPSGSTDTNETARFNNLTATDCSAGSLVIGVQNNGTVLCALDSSYNSTYDAYNSTGLIRNWNASGYIANWSIIIGSNEPNWNANYSTFLTISAWNNTGLIRDWNVSGLIRNWNSTSLIIDWNTTGFIKDWNSTGYIKNWNVDIISSNTSLYNWIVVQGYTAGGITWSDATNGTLMLQSTFDTNYTTNDASYRNITNLTYHTGYLYATNGTYYLATNPSSYITNATMNKSVYCGNIIGGSDGDYCVDTSGADGYNTTEEMQDAVGGALDGNFTYNDAGNSITVDLDLVTWLRNTLDSIYRLASSLIGANDISPNAVNNTHIVDGTIQDEDIAPSQINTTHIADGSILASDLNSNVNSSMDLRYVNINGDNMTGNLNITSFNITSSGTGKIYSNVTCIKLAGATSIMEIC